MQKHIKRSFGIIFLALAMWVITGVAAGQIPQDIPHQTDPVDFSSPLNILFFLGVPILMIVLYFMIRKMRRNRNDP